MHKVDQTGLNVVALVCDYKVPTIEVLFKTWKKVTIEKPFIKHGNKQVFVFYDPPHLLKKCKKQFEES